MSVDVARAQGAPMRRVDLSRTSSLPVPKPSPSSNAASQQSPSHSPAPLAHAAGGDAAAGATPSSPFNAAARFPRARSCTAGSSVGAKQPEELSPHSPLPASSPRAWIRGPPVVVGEVGRPSKVSLALDCQSGRVMAVKSVATGGLPRDMRQLEHELAVLQELTGIGGVVRVLGADWTEEDALGAASEAGSASGGAGCPAGSGGGSKCRTRNVLLEHVSGGSLSDLMASFGGRLPETLARRYARGLLEGLRDVHARRVVHCDVKAANVLINSATGQPKLCSFGLSIRSGDAPQRIARKQRLQGSYQWMAPEVIRQEDQDACSDIWSFGCTLIEMLTGQAPWAELLETEGPDLVLERVGRTDSIPEIPDDVSDACAKFLKRCLARDPARRPSAQQLLADPFLQQAKSPMREAAASAVAAVAAAVAGAGGSPPTYGRAPTITRTASLTGRPTTRGASDAEALTSSVNTSGGSSSSSSSGSGQVSGRSPSPLLGRHGLTSSSGSNSSSNGGGKAEGQQSLQQPPLQPRASPLHRVSGAASFNSSSTASPPRSGALLRTQSQPKTLFKESAESTSMDVDCNDETGPSLPGSVRRSPQGIPLGGKLQGKFPSNDSTTGANALSPPSSKALLIAPIPPPRLAVVGSSANQSSAALPPSPGRPHRRATSVQMEAGNGVSAGGRLGAGGTAADSMGAVGGSLSSSPPVMGLKSCLRRSTSCLASCSPATDGLRASDSPMREGRKSVAFAEPEGL